MKILPCAGSKSWTECGYEYDCEYGGECGCSDCVCSGGQFDPRYPLDKQPKKVPKFIERTRKEAQDRIRMEFEQHTTGANRH